jgi:hypothetical protein
MTVSDASVSFIWVLGRLEVVPEAGLTFPGRPKPRVVLGMLTVRAGAEFTSELSFSRSSIPSRSRPRDSKQPLSSTDPRSRSRRELEEVSCDEY